MDLWSYLLVFLTAAVPVLEVMVVIPASVAVGLHPIPVGVLAFAGNAVTLAAAVLAGDRMADWVARRRRPSGSGERSERRRQRVRRLTDRWGMPGLSLLGPISVGSHAAALAAVALRVPRRTVLVWSVGGVAAWSVVFTILSAAGASFVM